MIEIVFLLLIRSDVYVLYISYGHLLQCLSATHLTFSNQFVILTHLMAHFGKEISWEIAKYPKFWPPDLPFHSIHCCFISFSSLSISLQAISHISHKYTIILKWKRNVICVCVIILFLKIECTVWFRWEAPHIYSSSHKTYQRIHIIFIYIYKCMYINYKVLVWVGELINIVYWSPNKN